MSQHLVESGVTLFWLVWLAVIILQGATLSDLVRSLQRKVEEQCSRENRTEHLSWCVCVCVCWHLY